MVSSEPPAPAASFNSSVETVPRETAALDLREGERSVTRRKRSLPVGRFSLEGDCDLPGRLASEMVLLTPGEPGLASRSWEMELRLAVRGTKAFGSSSGTGSVEKVGSGLGGGNETWTSPGLCAIAGGGVWRGQLSTNESKEKGSGQTI